ncbi:unnamed protein product [Schistosoma curassoni]|uniref:Prohormone-4 n=1 Tax=Schistosoma curassoni TaxID=6186 RepID=A0A183KD64_9TREM|nr:unnamed protein product [Schistosoma curassoni]
MKLFEINSCLTTNYTVFNETYKKMFLLIKDTILGYTVERGNDCPESQPWPCRTPRICLSFDFICDGEPDCPDEYDEDPEMCTAKLRPAQEHLAGFIHRYQNWLVPKFLGYGTPEELAAKLVVHKVMPKRQNCVRIQNRIICSHIDH